MVCMYTFNGFQLPHIATTLGFVVLGADSDQQERRVGYSYHALEGL